MINLPGRLFDMLPENLQDARTAALGYALDRQMETLLAIGERMLVLADIPHLCEAFCDVLAVTFSVDGYDPAFDLDTKRALLQNILEVHARKGTAHAVRKVVGAIHGGADIAEWPEYGGEPFRFRIDVDARESKTGAVDRADLIRVVNATKSLRSHLEGIAVRTDSAARIELAALSASHRKTRGGASAQRTASSQTGITLAALSRASLSTTAHYTPNRPGGAQTVVQVCNAVRTRRRTKSIGVEN